MQLMERRHLDHPLTNVEGYIIYQPLSKKKHLKRVAFKALTEHSNPEQQALGVGLAHVCIPDPQQAKMYCWDKKSVYF